MTLMVELATSQPVIVMFYHCDTETDCQHAINNNITIFIMCKVLNKSNLSAKTHSQKNTHTPARTHAHAHTQTHKKKKLQKSYTYTHTPTHTHFNTCCTDKTVIFLI